MADNPTIDFDMSGMSEEERRKLLAAADKAGVQVRAAGGSQVTPAGEGTIETALSIKTAGLDDAAIEKLREQVYSNEQHSRILDSVLKGALKGYGVSGGAGLILFIEWLWCQWNKFAAYDGRPESEVFTKRYAVRPPREMLTVQPSSAVSGQQGKNW